MRSLVINIYINFKNVISYFFKICGGLFSAVIAILTFFPWNDIGGVTICDRVLFFIAIIIVSLIIAVLIITFKNTNVIWEQGGGKISIIYGDILKLGFPKQNVEKRIIVIPVNTHFDTIVDECISEVDKPLVSIKSIHGQWLKKICIDIKSEKLNAIIHDDLKSQNVQPDMDGDRSRGNAREYPIGTIAVVSGKNNVEFFLLALTKFDDNNNAQGSNDYFFEALRKLIGIYNRRGQGYPLYIPIMGTRLSRSGLSHADALNKIISILQLERDQIHGSINIVIYDEDRDKVSIWQ